MFVERLSADDTSRVRVYDGYPSKLGSRLDRANRGSTLNLKIINWENTPFLKFYVVEFFVNAKKRYILIQIHQIFVC